MRGRVIFDQCRDGALNMALDYLFLTQLEEREAIVVRFYQWCPATISIGVFQDWDRPAPYPVVRRPTGGKAVLHKGDLSYSVVAPLSGFGTSVMETYKLLSTALIQGLALLGVDAGFLPAPLPSKSDPEGCFVHPSGHEVGIANRKLIGSAQVRKPWGFLQHGAILMEPIYAELADLFGTPVEELRKHTITLKEVAPDVTAGLLAQALRDGFQEVLDVELEDIPLTEEELREAAKLAPKFMVTSA